MSSMDRRPLLLVAAGGLALLATRAWATAPSQPLARTASPVRATAPPAPRTGRDRWVVREDLQAKLPPSIVVRELVDEETPLRAWLVTARFDESWRPEATRPEKGLRTTSSQAAELGALVAVNAGFFGGSGSLSTVVDEGKLVCRGPAAVTRQGKPHPVTRAAIGFDREGQVDCAWIWCFDDEVYAFDDPAPNTLGKPAPEPLRRRGRLWEVEELLGAGPMLVEAGKLRITEVPECFQDIGGSSRHPRTAVGWTRKELLLLVIDGRSDASRGATLKETAEILEAHGAREALNFDGGGSTALWVAGSLVNRPSDRGGERAVGSILALVPATEEPTEQSSSE